jgi:hypothetical protein
MLDKRIVSPPFTESAFLLNQPYGTFHFNNHQLHWEGFNLN